MKLKFMLLLSTITIIINCICIFLSNGNLVLNISSVVSSILVVYASVGLYRINKQKLNTNDSKEDAIK